MGFVILWICCGIAGVMIARRKGNNELGGGCLGFILGPIGLLLVFFSSDNSDELKRRSGNTKVCPYCREYIKEDSSICRYCHQSVSNTFEVLNDRSLSPNETNLINYQNTDDFSFSTTLKGILLFIIALFLISILFD